jgi:hypothetical protein
VPAFSAGLAVAARLYPELSLRAVAVSVGCNNSKAKWFITGSLAGISRLPSSPGIFLIDDCQTEFYNY